MNFRTDLALEAAEIHKNISGLELHEQKQGNIIITKMHITSNEAAEKIGKPKGNYITITVPSLTESSVDQNEKIMTISQEISKLIPKKGLVLTVGLGNTEITPDALGPKSVDNVLATRHIAGELAKTIGLDKLRPVAVLKPSVLGKTGIEVYETLTSIIKAIHPSCLIIIDALASRRLSRLGCTIQLSDTGISPGAGVGNVRPLLDEKRLGIPVISIGVPTVVDASTLANDIMEESNGTLTNKIKNNVSSSGAKMIVTPKEIDLLINKASFLIGMGINCALHPDFSQEELHSLVS